MTSQPAAFANVYDALLSSVRNGPDRVAIVFEGESLTYADLLDRVENAARQLGALGITKGAVFAAYAQNRPELMLCYYAAARLGAVFVPVNPNLTPKEVAYTFDHSGARVLLHDDFVAASAAEAVAQDKRLPLSILLEPVEGVEGDLAADVAPGDDFLIIYTSGTTGVPKAIVLDHAAQVAGAASLSAMWAVSPRDVTLVALPLGYLYGLSTAAAVGLQTGGTVVILRRFHPRDVLEALIAHQATIFHGVPTMFSMMLDYCEQRGITFDLGGMRELICAGAPLTLETRNRFRGLFGKDLQNYYAMTESTPVFGKMAGDPRPIPEGAVGRAAPGLQVRIVRPDGSDCDTGEQGELLVRGAATMKRYMNAPDQTRAIFAGDLIRTGDLGHVDADGNYYITGRIKDIIIRGGANISPSEVEEALVTHPSVQDVAVVGAPDRIFGEVPVAFVVLRHGCVAADDELIAHAEARLSDFKVPRRYLYEARLPVGKTGKTDKNLLKQRLEQAD
ncbi:class I adenylate-forming enzyme family protein [Paracoccus pantotrophus]|uniref:class I adenylate-forming enzyme family protein n=1 Tax=Paracoccus pantotrophus TaxID=82367 RepID=UPI0004B86B33|nr:AMP-binding protein [Paracoccus pantotrophus]